MKQKMTRFLNHENLENQLILLRKNHMISSNLPTKIREEPKKIYWDWLDISKIQNCGEK